MKIKKAYPVPFKEPLLVFLIAPLAALLLSIKYHKQKWAKTIFLLFCVFFGLTFVVVTHSEKDVDKDTDAVRYKEWFVQLSKTDISSDNFISLLYSGGEEGIDSDIKYLDVVQPLITFFLSRVTSDYHVLFAFFALFFGYFYASNIWYVLNNCKKKSPLVIILFIVVFSLIVPIWRINAFRFNAAVHVFLYGAIPFIVEKDKKKLFLSVSSILVHFSFIFPVVVLLLYIIIGNRTTFFFILFLLTSTITETNLINSSDFLQSLPALYQGKVKVYDNAEQVESDVVYFDNAVWFIKYYASLFKFITYGCLIIIFFIGNKIIEVNQRLKRIFSCTLLFYVAANLANLFPQGERFYSIANMLVFFFVVYFYHHSTKLGEKLINNLRYFAVPVLMLIVIISLRLALEFASLSTLFGNPVFAVFFSAETPLIDLIK